MALMDDGSVRAWGYNASGQLGDGTQTQRNTPVAVPGLTDVTSIAAGPSNSVVVDDGHLYAWGANDYRQVGDGTTIDRRSPVAVDGVPSTFVAVAQGLAHTLALTSTGTVWSWGENGFGQLGRSSGSAPAVIPGLSNIVEIAAAADFSMARDNLGRIWTWGADYRGQLGRPCFGSTCNWNAQPGVVPGLTGMLAIAAGEYHALAVAADGSVESWGFNSSGQLGDEPSAIERDAPVTVSMLHGVSQVAAGEAHSLAVNAAGGLTAWGANAQGQLGDGTTIARRTPVMVLPATGDTTHYTIEMRTWIPQPLAVDPEQAPDFVQPFAVAALTRSPCYTPAVPLIPFTFVTNHYRGDDHEGFDGSFRVRAAVSFDWDGEQISNPSKETDFGTSVLEATYAYPFDTTTCVVASDRATEAADFQVLPDASVLGFYSAADPIPAIAPTVDATVTAAVAADGTIAMHFQTDEFPSHGIRVTRNGIVQRTDLVNDAACIPDAVLASPLGVPFLGGLLLKTNEGDRTIHPADAYTSGDSDTVLCGP